jgi:hypothetical protein
VCTIQLLAKHILFFFVEDAIFTFTTLTGLVHISILTKPLINFSENFKISTDCNSKQCMAEGRSWFALGTLCLFGCHQQDKGLYFKCNKKIELKKEYQFMKLVLKMIKYMEFSFYKMSILH